MLENVLICFVLHEVWKKAKMNLKNIFSKYVNNAEFHADLRFFEVV